MTVNKNVALLDDARKAKEAEKLALPPEIPTQLTFFAMGYAAQEGWKIHQEENRYPEPPEWADLLHDGLKKALEDDPNETAS
jgi:hypothetical protein